MQTLLLSAASLLTGQAVAQSSATPSSASAFTVPAKWPSSLFSSYYILPAPTQEPQPAIHDPLSGYLYPLNLTSGLTIPKFNPQPQPLPPAIGDIPPDSAESFKNGAIQQITEIVDGGGITGNCSKCVASLNVIKALALVAPDQTPDAMVTLCNRFALSSASTCNETFRKDTLGTIYTQLLAKADVSGLDGRYICNSLTSSSCSRPPSYPSVKAKFPKPKPANAMAPPPSGKRAKILQLSDFHLDPRYEYGSEANCTSGLCCRTNANNTKISMGQISQPAALYGSYACDSPYWLGVAALQAIHPLTETSKNHKSSSPLAFTLYTGDIASHDPASQLSRDYQDYSDAATFSLFHSFLRGPVFATLGNHDTVPVAVDDPGLLPGQFSWNYDHVAGLWLKNGWLDRDAAEQARLHYGGYSVMSHLGVRIISINTDFWYRANILNFFNASNPDVSGMQQWLIDELQAAEDCGEKVFIIGHVLSGWDGSNPLPNPTEYFYQIVERYSPHVIRNIFFGHVHEDLNFIFYASNGTNRDDPTLGLRDALTNGWCGPSVVPLTNLNSGFRMYEIDTGSFDVMEAKTYISDVNTYDTLDAAATGPVFEFEYSTRDAYGQAAGWPLDAPLNATFWHKVSLAMEAEANAAGNGTSALPLTQLYNRYQGKSSTKSPKCNTKNCALAKVCYMRSGSASLGRLCPSGFASVQSPFTGTP